VGAILGEARVGFGRKEGWFLVSGGMILGFDCDEKVVGFSKVLGGIQEARGK
jgi:hypothetical protein